MAATNGTQQQASALALLKRANSRWAKDNADDPAPDGYLEHLATFLQPVAPSADAAPPVDDRDLNLLREQVAAAENNAAARRAELDQARAEIESLRGQIQEAGAATEQRLEGQRLELQKHIDTQESRAERAERTLKDRGKLLEQTRTEVGDLRKECETQQRQVAEIHLAMESARRERDQLAEVLAATPNRQEGDTEQLREQAKLIGELRADYDAAAADTQKLADELQAMRADRDALVARVVAADQHECAWQWHGPDEPVKPCSCSRPVPRYEIREVS